MPRINYDWVIAVAIATYMLDYNVIGVCIAFSAVAFTWNKIATVASKSFRHVSRQDYEEVLQKNKSLADLIKSLNQHIENMEKKHKEELVQAEIQGQCNTFYVFLHEYNEFKYHLDNYTAVYGFDKNKKKSDKEEQENVKPKNRGKSSNWRNVLGVGLNADKAMTDKAYRDLAKKFHPDVNKNADAFSKMQEINLAKKEADNYFASIS